MFKIIPIFSSSATIVNLTYVSDGDTNDVLYYIGTVNNTTTFTNPQSVASPIIVTINTLSTGTLLSLTDRTTTSFGTTDVAQSNVIINLGIGRSLILNKYSLRARNIGSAYLRYWKLQGSNDNVNWIDLNQQSNNATLVAPSGWVSITVSGITTSYQYFKLIQNGANFNSTNVLTLGEIQLYGTYYYYN